MYFCFMNKTIKIIQQYVNTDDESPTRHMVLIELNGVTPIKAYIVELPKDWQFWDDKYRYYQINQN